MHLRWQVGSFLAENFAANLFIDMNHSLAGDWESLYPKASAQLPVRAATDGGSNISLIQQGNMTLSCILSMAFIYGKARFLFLTFLLLLISIPDGKHVSLL